MPHRTPCKTAAVAACALLLCLAGCAAQAGTPGRTLQAFASDAEIAQLFRLWAEQARDRGTRRAGPAAALSDAAPAVKAEAQSITNVQHAGVDEGGLVKRHGEHLVILRRGRLFTVRIGDDRLEPVAAVDAFGPGLEPAGAWYDELLVWGDTAVVIGYSYRRGGTEIGLFDIAEDGALTHRGTWHLRSNDYYSSRNYASRLIGSRLVLYTPLVVNPLSGDPFAQFPAMSKWTGGATRQDFRRIAPATRIYRSTGPLDPRHGIALHTVTSCDLAQPELACESTAVLGAPGRVFHVSGDAVYVWTTGWRRGPAHTGAASALFRMPLDGEPPTALQVSGSPVDAFSFLEGADGHLNVLVRAHGRGEGMWAAEAAADDLALLRVPLAAFSDGSEAAPREAYRRLPRPSGHAVHNRFVGDYLLYGAGAGWHRARRVLQAPLFAVRYADDAPVAEVTLAHGVDRIEALGRDAVVIGSDGRDLHFTTVQLGAAPHAVDRYTRTGAAQGETRSHGFFYRALDDNGGLIGLPVIGGRQPAARQLTRPSSAVLFLSQRALALEPLGALAAGPRAAVDDGCRASCVDWYGNSRPVFVQRRVFALMGYELIEGRVAGGRITEVRRVDFAPRALHPQS